MNMTGKYLSIWVSREEIEKIFGLDPTSTARV